MFSSELAEKLTVFWVGSLGPVVEICLIFVIIYSLLYFFRRTRALSVLWGFIVILLGLGFLAKALQLEVFQWILNNFWQLLATALIVIFQQELRRAFAQLGSFLSLHTHDAGQKERKEMIEEIVSAMTQMSIRRCGALIVLEQKIGLAAISRNAVQMDSKINSLLLQSLFYPNSPLHDGAVIIQGDKIVAAHAILPLTQEQHFLDLGTRHRAALGITEETDAIALVVSEETGDMSYAYHGELKKVKTDTELLEILKQKLLEQKKSISQEEKDKEP